MCSSDLHIESLPEVNFHLAPAVCLPWRGFFHPSAFHLSNPLPLSTPLLLSFAKEGPWSLFLPLFLSLFSSPPLSLSLSLPLSLTLSLSLSLSLSLTLFSLFLLCGP